MQEWPTEGIRGQLIPAKIPQTRVGHRLFMEASCYPLEGQAEAEAFYSVRASPAASEQRFDFGALRPWAVFHVPNLDQSCLLARMRANPRGAELERSDAQGFQVSYRNPSRNSSAYLLPTRCPKWRAVRGISGVANLSILQLPQCNQKASVGFDS